MEQKHTIFITGFPGFIAGRLVERLASVETAMCLLVQPAFVEQARSEIKRIAAARGISTEQFRIVEGDITKPKLGISNEVLTELFENVNEIYHLAAVYDLGVKKDLAFSVNVEGTKNVNDLARSIKNLSRYYYVSTCYVAGKRTGPIREAELEHSAGFRNYYEETKYLAEMDVEKLKAELPVTIYRPSVVVGDSETGETAKYDGIYYLIQYLMIAPGLLRVVNVGNEIVKLNLVPVDFVVAAMVALAGDERTVGKTIALADPGPLATAELFDQIAKKLVGKPSVITPPSPLVEMFLNSPISPPSTGLPHSAVPYFFISQTYDTKVADEMLAPFGVKCPRFDSYVGNLIDFVKKHPKL